MFARVTRGSIKPDSADELARVYRDSIMPAAREQNGFHSGTLLVDRSTSEAMSIALWATREDLEASERNGFYVEQLSRARPFFAGNPERAVYEVAVSTPASAVASPA